MIAGHGDDYQGELVANFSSNVWYGADNRALYQHLQQVLPQTVRYPEADAQSLREALATMHCTNASHIGVYNGSAEAVYRIAQSYAGSRSLVVGPTFAEYESGCRLFGHEMTTSSRLLLADKIAHEKPQLVWLCNPNNPDGYTFPKEILLQMAASFPDTHFVIDQAYAHFSVKEPISATEAVAAGNITLIQSLTKRYAIPGLRLGYLVSGAAQVSRYERFRIPWSINTLAIEAGCFILNNRQNDFPLREWLNEARRLQREIGQIGPFEPLPSETPFFLVKLSVGTAAGLKAFLLNKRILIRDANNFAGLSGETIRLNTLSLEQNNLLIENLKEWNQFITR